MTTTISIRRYLERLEAELRQAQMKLVRSRSERRKQNKEIGRLERLIARAKKDAGQ